MKLDKLTLKELNLLKSRLPERYNPLVREAYLMLNGKEIGERSVFNFFAGKTYTVAMHNAVLHVAEVYQNETLTLKKRTQGLIQSK